MWKIYRSCESTFLLVFRSHKFRDTISVIILIKPKGIKLLSQKKKERWKGEMKDLPEPRSTKFMKCTVDQREWFDGPEWFVDWLSTRPVDAEPLKYFLFDIVGHWCQRRWDTQYLHGLLRCGHLWHRLMVSWGVGAGGFSDHGWLSWPVYIPTRSRVR